LIPNKKPQFSSTLRTPQHAVEKSESQIVHLPVHFDVHIFQAYAMLPRIGRSDVSIYRRGQTYWWRRRVSLGNPAKLSIMLRITLRTPDKSVARRMALTLDMELGMVAVKYPAQVKSPDPKMIAAVYKEALEYKRDHIAAIQSRPPFNVELHRRYKFLHPLILPSRRCIDQSNSAPSHVSNAISIPLNIRQWCSDHTERWPCQYFGWRSNLVRATFARIGPKADCPLPAQLRSIVPSEHYDRFAPSLLPFSRPIIDSES